MYSNTPKSTFVKNFILDSGDTITISDTGRVILFESDTLEQQFQQLSESTGLSLPFLKLLRLQLDKA